MPFAAAHAVVFGALTVRAGAEAVTLAAAGPLGTEGRPGGEAIAAFSDLAGREAWIERTPPRPLRIETGGRALALDAADAAPNLEGIDTWRRGALIGCGFFAANHMLARARLEAGCDRDPARACSMAGRFDVARVFEDAAEMLHAGPLDFVDVAITAPSRLALAEAAGRRVPTVIRQKPFAETVADPEAMVADAEASGTTLPVL